MPRFAANLSFLFTELPFLDRFEAAAQAGFKAVEFMFPYSYATPELVSRLKANGLVMALHNFPPGDWDAGERGLASLPHRVADFKASVAQGLEAGQALGVLRMNCLAGLMPDPTQSAQHHDTLVANLHYAATEAAKAGIGLVTEPINYFDIPGFYLNTTRQALSILTQVNHPNLQLQYDIYHAQRMEGELANTLQNHLPQIGHIQIADNPGRHEPGTGEINWPFLFQHLDAIGYKGWVGCEYKPRTTTIAGLDWLNGYL